jgi:predicted nucleic acid-binding protein
VRQRVNWFYVITPDVAVFSGVPFEAMAKHAESVAVGCAALLGRATFHGAELNVPMIFRSDVIGLIAQLVARNVLDMQSAAAVAEDIFGTTWEFHWPTERDVLEGYRLLDFPMNTYAEYLAVALEKNSTIITADPAFVDAVNKSGSSVEIVFITDHPWARPGSLEDDPPNI